MRTTTIIAALLLAAACTKKKEAEPAAPTGPNIQSEEVTYKAGDTTLVGYVAWDANKQGPRPGVLVVHQWWGHSDYVRKRANMLAELGYTALALDMYGEGRHATHPDDAMKFMQETISNIEVATERGARTLYLEVREANEVARRMYDTDGFAVVGVRKQYYTEPVEDAIVMRLDLQSRVR